MLSAILSTRVVRFEVDAEREGRWTTESVAESESEAIEIARRLLGGKGCEAVRVMRALESRGSVVGTTEIFTERRPTGGADTRLASCDDEGAWCETLDDLYGNRSRRTIGQLLRGFLDANGVTPTEVLHSFRVYKRLDNADSLLSAAVSRIARARATATKTDGALTQRAIDQIVQQAAVRVRDAAAMRSVPTIGDGGLDALLAKFRKGYADPGEQRFQFRHSLCRVLEGCNGLPHRVEMVLDWSSTAKDPESIAVVDELAADCLGSAGVIKDMLGLQPDLGSALAMVVELARDRLKAFPAKAPPWLETLRKLLAGQGFEATRQVLLARVRRELGGERALTRDGAAGEAKALNVLCDRLFCDAQGVYLGGAEMVVAIARRYARLDRPGGFGDLPSASGAAVDRQIKTWLDYEREAFGEARKRAAGTMILAAVRSVERAGRRDLAGAGALVAASGLPEAARRAIAAELGIA